MIPRRLVFVTAACSLLTLCGPALARAQSVFDGFNPGTDGVINAFAVQLDGKIVVGGSFTMLGGGARANIGRLNFDGSLDLAFNPGVSDPTPFAQPTVRALAVQADGKILVGGDYKTLGGSSRSNIGRLNADGSLDSSFNPGANGFGVDVLVAQPNGKILVGGTFSVLASLTANNLGRLNADGSSDTSFAVWANAPVRTIALQRDGKILVGGDFTSITDANTGVAQQRHHIGRLNTNGSFDFAFNPGADYSVLALAVQVDGKVVVAGQFTTLSGGTRSNIGRLNDDGSLDAFFNPGANGWIGVVTVQADGKILVSGPFSGLGGGTRERIGRLNIDGSLDTGFNPGANAFVGPLAVQANGQILVGGQFTMLGGGGTGTTARNRIGRLYADGSLDADLNPGAIGTVYALAVQPDGRIVVGGAFTAFGGSFLPNLGRLRSNGLQDYSTVWPNGPVHALAAQPDGKIVVAGAFTQWYDGVYENNVPRSNLGRFVDPGVTDFSFNPGADGAVNALALQSDGKILVGGAFGVLSNNETLNFGRLNADGSPDASVAIWTNGPVHTIAVQPDGKILIGGEFTFLYDDNQGFQLTRQHLGRITADGMLDTSFDPGANGNVRALAVQADGKILVGGAFTTLGGGGTGTPTRNYIGRLNADGSLDPSFNPGASGTVDALAVQADARILVGGEFTILGGDYRSNIGRLDANGVLDVDFNPGAQNIVHALALQADGKILAGGAFTGLGGGTGSATPRLGIGRFTNTVPAIQRLTATNRIVWVRSGAGPAFSRVTFEASTDGVTYTPLGNGTRMASGWQLNGDSLPIYQTVLIRARGYYATGRGNGSNSIIESVRVAYPTVYQAFDDDVLIAGTTTIRAGQITDLRARIDAARMQFGLGAYPYSGATPTTGATIRALHLIEMRTAVSQAYAVAGLTAPVYTDPALGPGTGIGAIHIVELRAALAAIQ